MAVSKADLKAVLKKHEARETPAQEAAESKEEQRVEREAGVEKKAFWQGFEKKAIGFSINHKLDPNSARDIQQKIDSSIASAADKITSALSTATDKIEAAASRTTLKHQVDPSSVDKLTKGFENSSGKIIKQIESATKRMRKIAPTKLIAPALLLGGGLALGQGLGQFLAGVIKAKQPESNFQRGFQDRAQGV